MFRRFDHTWFDGGRTGRLFRPSDPAQRAHMTPREFAFLLAAWIAFDAAMLLSVLALRFHNF